MPAGRPSEFSQEIADAICERIAEGDSLRTVCADDEFPDKATVFRWLAKHQEFSDQYARAKEAQTEAFAEEILDIADDGTNDWMEMHDSRTGDCIGWRENGEAIRRSQTRIEARKWLMGKMKPKKYGEKLDLNVSGELSIADRVKRARERSTS